MILADKIINLRKKCGMSQEELADKLGVSRQSVSKWESAQCIPDLNKILQMADLFNVTTDYLLKDNIEHIENSEQAIEQNENIKRITMEEAQNYLQCAFKTRNGIAIGVLLCILSPITLILLGGLSEDHYFLNYLILPVGLSTLIIFVAIAVILFIINGMKLNKYEYLIKESIETEYGVYGMVKEKLQDYSSTYMTELVIGITLCILSTIPLFIFIAFDNTLLIICGVCILLCISAIGVSLMVHSGIKNRAFKVLLEEGDFTRTKKEIEKKTSVIMSIYWLIVTAFYLILSFITKEWDTTWIIWVGAGVLSPVVNLLASIFKK